MWAERGSLLTAIAAVISGVCVAFACHAEPPPVFAVTATMPSASASEVEKFLTIPLEQTLVSVPGLKSMRSESRRGGVVVFVTFGEGTDPSAALAKVDDAISNTTSSVPGQASAPVIKRVTGTGEPLLRYTLASDTMTSVELRHLNDELVQPALSRVAGVSEVAVCGGATWEVNVSVDATRLAATGVTPNAILAVIARGATAAFGADGAAKDLVELSRLVVATPQGMPLRLNDVTTMSLEPVAAGCGAYDGKGPVVEGEAHGQVGVDGPVAARALAARLAEVSRALPPTCRVTVLPVSRQSLFEISTSSSSSAVERTRIGAAVSARLAALVRDPARVLVRSPSDRPTTLELIIEDGTAGGVKTALADIPGIDVRSRARERIVRAGLMGNDLEILHRTAARLSELMRNSQLVTAVASDDLTRTREMTARLDRKRLAGVGASAADVAEVLRMAKGGVLAGWLRHRTGRLPIRLRTANTTVGRAAEAKEVLALTVPTSLGTAVPLSSLVEVRMEDEPALIVHENGQRAVTVRIDLKDGDDNSLRRRVRGLAQGMRLPAGVRLLWLDQ